MHLASLRKSALTQKPSAQIPKGFNQHVVADKTEKYYVWVILQIGYPSMHLASLRKSALVKKPSAKIPKDFNQHGIADETEKY